jgi:type III secretion protein V
MSPMPRVQTGAGLRGGWLERHGDVLVAGVVVAVVATMIVPLPPALLDVLLTTNLTLAVVLLALALQVREALQLSVFPTLLLLTTLFRLGLEISATRLVLLRGHAGSVVHAFGSLVVGGNLVVGLVVFSILTLVQYVVITKGAERVAEVAARFTLDGLPGKQMAIDADLRSGGIDLEGARRRRDRLDREAQLFGAMDGAVKYVRGDAVAALVILAINLVGGLAIGIWQRGMTAAGALHTYALLTVGGGLVAQLPALVISTAAGIIVTRTASESEGERPDGGTERLGSELLRQLGQQPKAIAVGGGLLLALALVPGLPTWPFALLGGCGCLLAWGQSRALAARRLRADDARGTPPLYRIERRVNVLVSPVALGDRLGPVADRAGAWRALATTVTARMAARLGVALPLLVMSEGRGPEAIVIEIDGIRRSLGAAAPASHPVEPVEPHRARSAATSSSPPGPGAAEDPAWMSTALAVTRALEARIWSLMGVDDTAAWLDRCRQAHPALVREVVPRTISLARLNEVLRGLAREGVSLRSPVSILESLATVPPGGTGDAAALVEQVRSALGEALVTAHLDAEGRLPVVELESLIEDALRDGIRHLGDGRYVAIEPALSEDIVAAIRTATIPPMADAGQGLPVLLTHKDLRRHLRQLVEASLPELPVVAYSELPAALTLLTVGRARVGARGGADAPPRAPHGSL